MRLPGLAKDGTCYAWWSDVWQERLAKATGSRQPIVALPLEGHLVALPVTYITATPEPPDNSPDWVCLGRGTLHATRKVTGG